MIGFSKLAKLTVQVAIISMFILIFWILYLNVTVRDLFEGRRFHIPARVYSEAQELYSGATLQRHELIALLQQLGYRRSSDATQPGRYVEHGKLLTLYSRGFQFWDREEPAQQLTLDFDEHGITNLIDAEGQPVLLTRLDPLFLGQVYPGAAEDRVLYRLNQVPERLVLGLLLLEDERFFSHWGISLRGIVRALMVNISAGEAVQGGSTLTNQLVKNLYLSPDKTLLRKINEALMSLILEFHFSKNDILETYINEVYVGQQGDRAIHGFGLGAQFYFGTTLQGLDIHQQALLVGLIKGPSFYNPRRNPERAKARRDLVLGVWHEQGLITDQDYMTALAQPLDISATPRQTIIPAFMQLLRQQLARDYRKQDLLAEGLSVFTTLDPIAQTTLEQELARGVASIEQQFALAPKKLQGAAVMTRPSTADVLALVGDRDPKSSGFNRALNAFRPVGSLMKPAVYLAALEQGNNLATPISDEEVAVAAADGVIWQPKNYDNQSHGMPMLIDGLAKSYNQATARLGMEVGMPKVFDVIARLGVAGDVPTVPAVMLGAHSMSPLQVAQMYQTIAGNGFYSPLNLIRAVSHPQLGTVQRFALDVDKRFAANHIYLLQAALHEATQTGTARRLATVFNEDWWIAGKTGTTNDNRDAWFAGYTGDRQLVVWVGRDDNEATPLTGSSGALPIWINVMKNLNPLQERRSTPPDIRYVEVNNSGIRVPDWCRDRRRLPFVAGTEPERSLSCNADNTKPSADEPSWWQRFFG